jgi:hypothetical protein
MNIAKEVAKLEKMTVNELREKFAEVCGEETTARNRTWLIRRIAWRLQANIHGGLSQRALARARELARDADLRVTAPRSQSVPKTPPSRTRPTTLAISGDDRLPPPGTEIVRQYKGRTLKVLVLANGFEFEGEVYKSLSAVAKQITGSHCNGFLFFRLTGGAK